MTLPPRVSLVSLMDCCRLRGPPFGVRDIAPEGASLAESNAMLEKVVELAEHLQKETGKKVLWGTAQLFKHPRFAHGAATSAFPLLSLRTNISSGVRDAMINFFSLS